MARAYNFSAGPAILPEEVLNQVQAELLDFNGTGMSIMEMSHRGKDYSAVHQEAKDNLKALLNIPENYSILFMTGGASTQFSLIPMNLLGEGETADYITAGAWSTKAIKAAQKLGVNVNELANTAKDIPTCVPGNDLAFTPGAAYVHICSNETISGAQVKEFPKTDAPLIADMSSDILSRPLDVSQFDMIYAGAQKNIGPSGTAMVIIRKDMLQRTPDNLPSMLKYTTFAGKNSMYNTPSCIVIYTINLVLKWLEETVGGLEKMQQINQEKGALIYDFIDQSDFYNGTAEKESRSLMNVTFRLPSEELEKKFVAEGLKEGLGGLKGHRSVGGCRASIYNASGMDAVKALVDFMIDFEKKES